MSKRKPVMKLEVKPMEATYKADQEGYVRDNFKITSRGIETSPHGGENNRISSLSLSQLSLGPTLGKGASAEVRRATHNETGIQIALKILNIHTDANRKQLQSELNTLIRCPCQFLMMLYDAFYEGENVYVALEFMNAGSLHDNIQRFGPPDEAVIASVMAQLLFGLEYLHKEAHRIHRDLKPENVLMNMDGMAKVSDFGTSRVLDGTVPEVGTFVGTAIYMSPERMDGKTYGAPSDIWALGIIAMEMALGRYPYNLSEASSFFDLHQEITLNDVPLPDPNRYSPMFVDFVRHCLQKNPAERPDATKLLTHNFISQHAARGVEPVKMWLNGQ